MSNNRNNNEPKFDEMQAYYELCKIIEIAIQTQNFVNLEPNIAVWQKKYPLADFTNIEILRKIKYILSKDFLSRIVGDYLAAKILHEKEKQKHAYESLQGIIDSAAKNKDYKTAEHEVRRWRTKLKDNHMTLYSFDNYYRTKIYRLLLVPSRKIKEQENAQRDLKQLEEKGQKLDVKELSKEIADWQNTYCIENFPEKLQRKLNPIAANILKSISDREVEESYCIRDLQDLAAHTSIKKPVDTLALVLSKYDYSHFSSDIKNQIDTLSKKIISIPDLSHLDSETRSDDVDKLLDQKSTSSVQLTALNELKSLFDRNNHDMDSLLNWIYTNRKISFSQFAREDIIRQFVNAGYKIPVQSAYYIPDIKADFINQDMSEINKVKREVIINYLGIISTGKTLSKIAKENILAAQVPSDAEDQMNNSNQENNRDVAFVLPVFDTLPKVTQKEFKEFSTSQIESEGNDTIIIDDNFFENPSAVTYTIPKRSVKSQENNSEITLVDHDNKEKKEISIPVFTTDLPSNDTHISLSSNGETTERTTKDDFSPFKLTLEDLAHLEKAYNEFTYISISYPLLQHVTYPQYALSYETDQPSKDFI